MAFLELENISKYFGQNAAVENINLSVERGEFLTLLGPSGCGKTTILRMIAGFETPSAGNILLDNEDITNLAASKRPMGMVFQAYALFPHMTAEQNIAFGLNIQRKPKDAIKRRCAELLDLVGLSDKGGSFPHQLSGGQQQRIALARALAVEPKVLLLDEPLSALDAKVRVSLRNEIRHVQQQLKMTAIYVTHDQEEALAISDRIAVMARGHIEQLDHPEEIYSNPRTVFAASFVGNSNQFRGSLVSVREGLFQSGDFLLRVPPQQDLTDGQQAMVLVRPEEMSISPTTEGEVTSENSSGNHISGVIELRTFLGPFTRFHIRVNDHLILTADIPNQQSRDYYVAEHVVLSFSPGACQVLPLDSEESSIVKQAEKETV